MRICIVLWFMVVALPALAAPSILTFKEVGEIKEATFTGKVGGASEGLSVSAGQCALGRWDGDGGRWNSEYPLVKRYFTPHDKLRLTSGVNRRIEMRHDPKQLTLKTASNKVFTFVVPAFRVTKEGQYLLDNGKSLGPEHSLYLGNDGKCYLDEKATQPAGP